MTAEMHIEGNTARVVDAIVLVQDGRVVARAHATYDLSEFPEEYLEYLGWIRRHRIGLISTETLKEYAIRQPNQERRLAAYEALPWWRRVFSRQPRFFDPENLSDPIRSQKEGEA